MRQTDTELHLSRLEKELSGRTAGASIESEIQQVLRQALRDLKGSVSRESLPEMATRLAVARLGSAEHKALMAV